MAGVCGCLGGWGRLVSQVPGLRTMVGVCGPPGWKWGGTHRGGGCVWGLWGWGRVYCFSVCVRLQRRACVVTRRPGSSEEKLAVFCGRGKDFADERAYLGTSWSVVGRGYCSAGLRSMRQRTLWMAWHPQARGCCGLSGDLSACLGLPRLVFGRWGWPRSRARYRGWPAVLDPLGREGHGQSQVVVCPPRGDLGQGARRGLVPGLEDAPENFVRGGGFPYCPWWGGPSGEHAAGPFDEAF